MGTTENESGYKWITVFLAVIAGILTLAVLKLLRAQLLPLILAMIFFFLFSPLTVRLDRWHVPHALSVVICFFLTIVIMVAIWAMISRTILMLVQAVPHYNDRIVFLDQQLAQFLARYPKLGISGDVSIIENLPVNWRSLVVDTLTTVTASVIEVVKLCVMILLYELFLLMERPVFIPKIRAALGEKGGMFAMMSERISKQVSKYLLLKALISFFTGVCFYLIAFCTGMEVPLMYGVLAFVFNFIPSIGSIIVTLVTIAMSVVQFAPQWGPIVVVTIGTVMTQMILGNIIDPKLQGGQLNLSPVVILVALSVWGYIWGIAGMFLAVPLMSMIEIVCANIKVLRPIAIMLSGGRSYLRVSAKQQRKNEKKAEQEGGKAPRDIVLPDDFNGSR